ncbi:MAG: hypothetical protein F4169_11900 [Gammaproteobacteria bacterium]|nr:hypothetical protein [Gammaproteobacteria bacterium]
MMQPSNSAPRLLVHEQTDSVSAEFDGGDAIGWILGFDPSDVSFLDDVLGRHVLHCKDARKTRFSGTVSSDALGRVLGTFGLSLPQVRVVRFDRPVKRSEYSWGGLVDPMRVGRLFAEGSTVIFEALHDRHEPLRRLCAALAAQAGTRAQTNIYLTPPDSQGFKPHWDTHDVFVMQVEGSKRWRIYDGGCELPVASQTFDLEKHGPGSVEAEFEVSAGDVVYIPRGIMHAAETRDEASLHVTLGMIAYPWAEFLGQCLGELVLRDSRWREDLPFGFVADAESGFSAVEAELRNRLAALADEIDVEAVLLQKLDDVGAAFRPRASDYLAQSMHAEHLEPGDSVRCRPGLHYRMEKRDGRVLVFSSGRQLDFPDVAEKTVAAVLNGGPVAAGAIADGLDWSGRKAVLETMIREGILVRPQEQS